jgi:hypothetical protein
MNRNKQHKNSTSNVSHSGGYSSKFRWLITTGVLVLFASVFFIQTKVVAAEEIQVYKS